MSDETGRWVRAAAPASVSNVCCGFDLLGFAVAGWQDVVEARRSPRPGVRLVEVTGDGGRLPRGADENTAGVAVARLFELMDRGEDEPGVELRLHKGLPLASGLGSSGASAVAALVATDRALGLGAGEALLLAAAMEGERVACGAAHPDNVAPSLRGGLLLVRPGQPSTPAAVPARPGQPSVLPEMPAAVAQPPTLTELPVPAGLICVLLHPHSEVATEAARAVLPAEVPLATLTAQAGNLAALVTGLFRERRPPDRRRPGGPGGRAGAGGDDPGLRGGAAGRGGGGRPGSRAVGLRPDDVRLGPRERAGGADRRGDAGGPRLARPPRGRRPDLAGRRSRRQSPRRRGPG